MDLTQTDIALIRKSIERLTDPRTGRDPFGREFYGALFEEAPETKALFREDLSEQGMRFLSTLRLIAEALDAPETLSDHMTRLAEGHRAYGVRPEHYAPMGRALRRALKQALGERYDGETDAAWDRAYQAMSQKMQAV